VLVIEDDDNQALENRVKPFSAVPIRDTAVPVPIQ
jgi:hypothetical protein